MVSDCRLTTIGLSKEKKVSSSTRKLHNFARYPSIVLNASKTSYKRMAMQMQEATFKYNSCPLDVGKKFEDTILVPR